ncbi:hypothetical protein HQ403_02135 [Candidatus Kaiserbacteria bacterium]|nr:hypothetical protein [Candidatus Kaiserbacteria bacterium]
MDPNTLGLTGLLLMSIIMANGFAMIIGGPKAVGRLNRWLLKKTRNLIGGILTWIGKQIHS